MDVWRTDQARYTFSDFVQWELKNLFLNEGRPIDIIAHNKPLFLNLDLFFVKV